jgi:transaldolase
MHFAFESLLIVLLSVASAPTARAFTVSPAHMATRGTTALDASALDELATMTTISIDSGDLDVVQAYAKTGLITDATTNPLFVSQAGSKGDARYQDMVQDAIAYAKETLGGGDATLPNPSMKIDLAMDKLAVNLGAQLATFVKGRVSTEVDIRLSYDTDQSVARALRIIDMYESEMGISRDRILIKLAGTWEGIQAARILEKEHGIQCNITLVFSFLQAAASAQAGAYLISPFPGRILDWYKSKNGKEGYHPTADPGVLTVKRMYAYFRKYDYKTICMPASWRPSRGAAVDGSDVDEILALAGVDEMTIPEALLESLINRDASEVVRACDAHGDAATCLDPDFVLTKETWDQYWAVDLCGQDKLKEGIASFTKETEKLRDILIDQFH